MYIILFSNGGSNAYFKVFHCVNLIILNFQGVSGPGERGGGNPEPPLDLRMPVRLSGFG